MFPYKYSDPNDPDTTVGYIDTTLTSVSQLKSQIDDVNSYYNNWVQKTLLFHSIQYEYRVPLLEI